MRISDGFHIRKPAVCAESVRCCMQGLYPLWWRAVFGKAEPGTLLPGQMPRQKPVDCWHRPISARPAPVRDECLMAKGYGPSMQRSRHFTTSCLTCRKGDGLMSADSSRSNLAVKSIPAPNEATILPALKTFENVELEIQIASTCRYIVFDDVPVIIHFSI